MDIEALNTFLTLANTKNYTRTAAQLFVAQSTVTNRIHELEKELNIALFTRNNRSVELTVEGEQFKDYAEKVITLTNASLSEISSLHKYENHLRIGCSDSIYEGHLAPIILEHRRQFPNDALKITIGLSNHNLFNNRSCCIRNNRKRSPRNLFQVGLQLLRRCHFGSRRVCTSHDYILCGTVFHNRQRRILTNPLTLIIFTI